MEINEDINKQKKNELRRFKRDPFRQTNGMEHRRYKEDCPLCPLWGIPYNENDPSTRGKQHIYAEELWQAWSPSGRQKNWVKHVQEILKTRNIQASDQEIKDHFALHRIEQPAMSGNLKREKLLIEATNLSAVQREIVVSVFRQRFLSTQQIADVFYRPLHTEQAARYAAKTELPELAHNHFLYRFFMDKNIADKLRNPPPHFAKAQLWFLGKGAIPFIEDELRTSVLRNHYLQMAKEVGLEQVTHDLKANHVFVSLHKKIYGENNAVKKPKSLPGQSKIINLELLTRNWFGPRDLQLGFYDRYLGQEYREIKPDGFMAVSVHRSGYGPGELPNSLMPLFYEYDHGTRDVSHVTRQLLAYHLMSTSSAFKKRFPELKAEGYKPPVLMVFSDRKRMNLVHKNFQKVIREERRLAELKKNNEGSPIFITCEEDWNPNPLADNIIQELWHNPEDKFDFLYLLVEASKPLLHGRPLSSNHELLIDLDGAKPKSVGATSEEGLAEIRQRQKIKEQVERSSSDLLALVQKYGNKDEKIKEEKRKRGRPRKQEIIAEEEKSREEKNENVNTGTPSQDVQNRQAAQEVETDNSQTIAEELVQEEQVNAKEEKPQLTTKEKELAERERLLQEREAALRKQEEEKRQEEKRQAEKIRIEKEKQELEKQLEEAQFEKEKEENEEKRRQEQAEKERQRKEKILKEKERREEERLQRLEEIKREAREKVRREFAEKKREEERRWLEENLQEEEPPVFEEETESEEELDLAWEPPEDNDFQVPSFDEEIVFDKVDESIEDNEDIEEDKEYYFDDSSDKEDVPGYEFDDPEEDEDDEDAFEELEDDDDEDSFEDLEESTDPQEGLLVPNPFEDDQLVKESKEERVKHNIAPPPPPPEVESPPIMEPLISSELDEKDMETPYSLTGGLSEEVDPSFEYDFLDESGEEDKKEFSIPDSKEETAPIEPVLDSPDNPAARRRRRRRAS